MNLTTPTTSDNCGVASVTKNHASALYPVGATIVIWTVTDNAGNTATSSQTVTVTDNQAPTITTNTTFTANTAAGLAYAVITLTPPTGTDNNGTPTITKNHASTQYPVGNTVVIWTATDASGNTATSSQTVTVTDNEAPVAIAKNISVTLSGGHATITPASVDNGSHDNVGITSQTVSPSSFGCNNIGANTVKLTCTDAHGNTATVNCTVTVIGAVPTRTITCTPSNNTYTGGDCSKIYLGYGPQTITLNGTCGGGTSFTHSWCGGSGLSATNCQYPTFTGSSECHPTFTVTTTNNYGCTSTSSQDICVKDARDHYHNNKVIVCHHNYRHSSSHSSYSCNSSDIPSHICSNSGSHSDDNHGDHQPDHLGSHYHQDCDDQGGDDDDDRKAASFTDAQAAAHDLELFPNPSSTTSTIYFDAKADEAYILNFTDNTGRIVKSIHGSSIAGENHLTVDVNNLSQGFYLVSLQKDDGIYKTKLIRE